MGGTWRPCSISGKAKDLLCARVGVAVLEFFHPRNFGNAGKGVAVRNHGQSAPYQTQARLRERLFGALMIASKRCERHPWGKGRLSTLETCTTLMATGMTKAFQLVGCTQALALTSRKQDPRELA